MRMHAVIGLLVLAAAVSGCTSKLVRIDSEPGPAQIHINGEYAGKTPLHYRFWDIWQPWPLSENDNYTVRAFYNDRYYESEKVFTDTPAPVNIGYVPDEIVFDLRPIMDFWDTE